MTIIILKELLERANMPLLEVAKITRIPQPRFSEWINGKRTPKLDVLKEIAINLNLDIGFIIKKINT